MKITNVTNSDLIIQAKDQKDFDLTNKVADRMSEYLDCTIVADCEYELWVHISMVWDNYQAKELKDAYTEAKKDVLNSTKPA